ncbi:MAG: hypothetical protein KW804_02965 [Candidatus Doudnabacteria bacterium]|nr:hypothetical protein [Candidatus Doudnabacteria bacterium]
MTPYQPTSLAHTVVAVIFYLIMAALMIYSLLALYALLNFGRSKILGAIISILYLIIIASLYAAAVGNLNQI